MTAPRWCSAATWKSRSPISRASPRKTRKLSATGIARRKKSPARFSCPNAMPNRCLSKSATRCSRARRWAANSSRSQPSAARCGARAVRERARATAFLVQGVAVRHLAGRYAVENIADGLGDPRLRPGKRLPTMPGRLVQSGARPDGGIHRRRRHLSAASAHRQNRHRERQGHRHRTRDGRTVRARQFVASTLDVHQTFENLVGRAQLPRRLPRKSSTTSSTPPGACSGCISRSTKARVLPPRSSIPISIAP